jgi:hypothetical protein
MVTVFLKLDNGLRTAEFQRGDSPDYSFTLGKENSGRWFSNNNMNLLHGNRYAGGEELLMDEDARCAKVVVLRSCSSFYIPILFSGRM